YKNEDDPIPFRRRVFSSAKDGILQLVLLGWEDRCKVPDWILRLANDRAGWDMYPWGRLPAARLTSDENEVVSNWWVLSRAYFDGCISEATRIPRHVNRQNLSDVPSEFYREFEEQQRAVDQMMKKDAEREEMYDQMRNFMQDMNVGPVRQAKKGPIIVSQHYGLSDFSGFQSMQGFPHAGLSSLPTQANSSFFEGAQATPSYGHNMATLNWQTPMPSHPGTSNWKTQMPSRSATPNWQTPMPSHLGTSNWHTPIPSHPHDAGLFNPNILNRERREVRPNMYRRTPYMDLPPTTVLPKKRGDKTKNKGKNANISPLNLGNAFADDNVGEDDIMFLGVQYTGKYLVYENVDPSKVYMPINAGGNHWVTGAVNLPNSLFYVFDFMHSEGTRLMLTQQIRDWTPVVNGILQSHGYFNGTGRQPHNFHVVYNDGLGYAVSQQPNFKNCRVIACWLIFKLCVDQETIVHGDSQMFWENIRYQMLQMFYKCRCGNTKNCGYD
ncbi:phospholipase-like protein, partial [Tanacetum coccineum]